VVGRSDTFTVLAAQPATTERLGLVGTVNSRRPAWPHGLDEFVDGVVPLLQDRGTFRTEYRGFTLREHRGI